MIRITAGTLKGRRIEAPPSLRPTTDRTRQAAFNLIGDAILDGHVLDAAAGTGAYGIEALSRGARSTVFVEADRRAVEALMESLRRLSISNGIVTAGRIERFAIDARHAGRRFDVVFFDPPYDQSAESDLEALWPLTEPGGVLVYERRHDAAAPPELEGAVIDRRRYGKTELVVYRRAERSRL